MTLPQFGQNIARIDIELADILDLNIVAPAAGDILIYDGDSWDNQPVTGDITITAGGVVAIAPGVIVDADISATAEIAVSKLADGAARQVLETAADGVTVQWASNVDLPGTLDVTALAPFDTAITLAEGIAQAGTDVYLARDNAGDLTLNALVGKTINLAIAGTDEYLFSVSSLSLEANTLTNIANAGSSLTGTVWTMAADNGPAHSTLTVQNLETTGATQSNAIIEALVSVTAGNDTGNPIMRWTVTGGRTWAAGVDNSDGDKFMIKSATDVGPGIGAWVMDNRTTGISDARWIYYRNIDPMLDDSASARFRVLHVESASVTLTGTTPITQSWNYVDFAQLNIVQSGGAVTINQVSAVQIAGVRVDASITATSSRILTLVQPSSDPGTTTTRYGIFIGSLTQGGTNIGISMANDLDLRSAGSILNVVNPGNDWDGTSLRETNLVAIGVAGSSQGSLTLAGVTSGVVTVAVAAAAGTWTMTLPTAVGGAGEQLTDAAGNGITSWAAAASLRAYKQDIAPWACPQDALDQLLGTQVYAFNYREGRGTLDPDTRYVGLMADEAPWAMHYNGGIINPVNTLGYMVLGFQAQETRFSKVEDRLEAVEEVLDIVRAQVVALGAAPEA